MSSSASLKRLLLVLLMGLILWAMTAVTAARAEDHLPRFLQFAVQDQDGNFFPIGEVEFCTPEGECLYADIKPGFPGNFYLDSELLEPGQTYSVRIYDRRVAVHYEMRSWTFRPQDYDPLFDPFVNVEKFLIFPRFQGTDEGGLVFRLDTTLNPKWVNRRELPRYTGPDTLPAHPRLLASVSMPIMLGGKFGTDASALGGVDDVRPGLGLAGAWLSGYPRKLPERDGWIPFRELGLAYEQNRYEVRDIVAPGRRSDVTFHRFKVSFGLGRLAPSYASQWSVGVQGAVGGMYDGTQLLKYNGRSYSRLGAGIYAGYTRRMFEVGRVDVALRARTELMYYFADKGPDDFWFGLAPTVSLGLVVF